MMIGKILAENTRIVNSRLILGFKHLKIKGNELDDIR
jgi:hypothetical protein